MAKKSFGSNKNRNGDRVEFDKQARIAFVTGFRKRKNERREKAKVMLKEEEKEKHQ